METKNKIGIFKILGIIFVLYGALLLLFGRIWLNNTGIFVMRGKGDIWSNFNNYIIVSFIGMLVGVIFLIIDHFKK